jgi:hypothetical protein
MTAWLPGTEPFATYRQFGPPPQPGVGQAEDWGREEYVASLLSDAFDLRFETAESPFVGSDAEEMWQRSLSAGPTKALLASLEPPDQERLHRAIVDYLDANRVSGENGGIRAPAEYLLILGVRRRARGDGD